MEVASWNLKVPVPVLFSYIKGLEPEVCLILGNGALSEFFISAGVSVYLLKQVINYSIMSRFCALKGLLFMPFVRYQPASQLTVLLRSSGCSIF